MANVTMYLNKILSAVYGKDVRQSIYDSINAINTQVEVSICRVIPILLPEQRSR